MIRIDYQQGDHLRVGRLLIARARQAEGAPIVDGGGTVLTRHDEAKAVAAVQALDVLLAEGHDVTGGAWMVARRHVEHARAMLAEFIDTTSIEHFGALVVREPEREWRARLPRAVAFGWLDARPPHPARWRPRFLLAHVRWVLAGRPANVRTLGGESAGAVEFIERSALGDDGAVPAVFDTPFGDPPAGNVGPVELWHDVTPIGDGHQ